MPASDRQLQLLSKFLEEPIDHQQKELLGGFLISGFLWKRIADTLDKKDALAKEVVLQFTINGRLKVIDPTNERLDQIEEAPAIIKSYPHAVAATVTMACAVECGFCFRADIISSQAKFDKDLFDQAIHWLSRAENKNIHTAVISGGDLGTLHPTDFRYVVAELSKIENILEIRLDTRILTTKPAFITKMKANQQTLETYFKKLRFVAHINSWSELDHPEVTSAVDIVRKSGVPISNQAVMLRGINATPEQMSKLVLACKKEGIRFEYIYHLDGAEKDNPFFVNHKTFIEVLREIWSDKFAGLDKPSFVYVRPDSNTKQRFFLSPLTSDEQLRALLQERDALYAATLE